MGRTPQFSWDELKTVFIQGQMPWYELSSERNGNTPHRPKRNTLYRRYKDELWEQLRDAYRANKPNAVVVQLVDAGEEPKIRAALLAPPGGEVGDVIDHYTKNLPDETLDDYRSAVSDPDLMAMRRDIAVVNSLIANCLKRMRSGESGDIWGKVKKQAREVLDSQGDPIKAKASLTQLLKTIGKGNPFVELQKELLLLMKERSNLIEKETARLEKLQQYANRQDVHELLRTVGDIIRQEVGDPTTLKRIGQQIRKLRLS
jgi:hypothetical protein